MTGKKTVLCLGLILLLGAGLRIYRVGAEGIWLDEGVTVARAKTSISRIIGGRDPDPSPPLYYLLMHSWIRGFGDSELSLRLPSVIFGSLAILLIYRAGGVFFNRRTGLTTALILALAAFPVYFSREARMYSLLLLLALASYYCLGKMIRGGSKTAGAGYLLATAGVIYTHNLGISVVLAQNLFLLIVFIRRGRAGALGVRRWYAVQGLLLLLYLPALAVISRQLRFIQGNYWSPPPRAADLWNTVRHYGGSAAAAVVCCGLAAAALLPGSTRKDLGEKAFPHDRLLLCSWLLTPILLPFLISLVSTPIYMPRVTIAAAPAFYLLAARGLERIPKSGIRMGLTGLLGIILILPVLDFYHPPRNEPWREVVRLVEGAAEPGDRVLVSPPWYLWFCFEHYRTRDDISTRGVGKEVFSESGIPRLREETGRYPRVWIIDFQERDLSPRLEENFPERFRPEFSRVAEYFNFQAGSRMGIRTYLLGPPRGQ